MEDTQAHHFMGAARRAAWITIIVMSLAGCMADNDSDTPPGTSLALDDESNQSSLLVLDDESHQSLHVINPLVILDDQAPQRPILEKHMGATSTLSPKVDSLVVHEWGTFTSVQASDGSTLDGLHHEEEPLPNFVYGRGDFSHFGALGKSMEILPEPVNQKMETPVIYFYSPSKKDVQVKVDFPKGFISEWYPNMEDMQPQLYGASKIAGGSMTWNVNVDPDIDMAEAEQVDPDDIWAPSRQVAATPLRVGGEVERFIFYRGVGRFTLPIRVTNTNETAEIKNDSSDVIPRVFLLRVTQNGDTITGNVTDLGQLDMMSNTLHALPGDELSQQAYMKKVRTMLAVALEESGLFKDEAWAMVNTWSHSYFETPGLRMLYILPRPWTDSLLPIQITPEPDALERTLVGRIELLTPAVENNAMGLILKLSKSLVNLSDMTWATMVSDELGRFAEPLARRVCGVLADEGAEDAKAFCTKLLPAMHRTF